MRESRKTGSTEEVEETALEFTDVITMAGAIATFLFGMTTMTKGLEKISSGRLESILEKLTDNVFKGVLLGALITAIIHSSATTTVMCVGFVNAGIMHLEQTVGIIMGANIGTTITAQILRLSSISSNGNIFLTILQPSVLGPVLAVVGIILYMFISGGRKANVGQILLGMGLLFIGMNTMTASVSGLQNEPWLAELFTAVSNPLLGMLVGAALTALLQSSTAFTGILLALSTTGAITFGAAVPLILGQNIGTTLTALISSTGASKNAKRTALIHLFFNVFGSLFFLVALYAGNAIFHFPFWSHTVDMGSIANFHLIFNLACTALLLPFRKGLVRLVEWLVPGDKEEVEASILDERFLASPSLAIEKSHEAVVQMGTLARENFKRSLELLMTYDEKTMDRLQEVEDVIDRLENNLDNYLVRLSKKSLNAQDSNRVSELLHTLSDFERIGDYVVNIGECAQAIQERGIEFSPEAKGELKTMMTAVNQILAMALACYTERSVAMAKQVEPLEEVIDLMRDELRGRHIERLKAGECTVEVGTQFLELLINLERVADHCSNVAKYILREEAHAGDPVRENTHLYFHQLHQGGSDADFDQMFAEYKSQYYDALQAWTPPAEVPPMFREEQAQG